MDHSVLRTLNRCIHKLEFERNLQREQQARPAPVRSRPGSLARARVRASGAWRARACAPTSPFGVLSTRRASDAALSCAFVPPQRKVDERDQERTAMQLIDWHDFVLVETLNFNEDGSDCASAHLPECASAHLRECASVHSRLVARPCGRALQVPLADPRRACGMR